jgi:hypothetical protein
MDTPTDIVARLDAWTRSIEDELPEPEPAVALMKDAAADVEAMRLEIRRLRKLIDDYVYIAKASSDEIYNLRHGMPVTVPDEQ